MIYQLNGGKLMGVKWQRQLIAPQLVNKFTLTFQCAELKVEQSAL